MSIVKVRDILACALLVVLTAVGVRVYLLTARVDAYLTPDVIRDIHNDVTTSAIAAQSTANAYAEIAKSTVDVLDHSVKPAIERLSNSTDRSLVTLNRQLDMLAPVLSGLADTTGTANRQLEQFGKDLHSNQVEVGSLLVYTREQVLKEIAAVAVDAHATSGRVRILVDEIDPQIQEDLASLGRSLGNVEIVTKNAGGVTENLNLTTGDIQKWTHNQLFPTPQKGFAGFMKRYVLAPLRTVGGTVYLYLKIANGL